MVYIPVYTSITAKERFLFFPLCVEVVCVPIKKSNVVFKFPSNDVNLHTLA